MCKTFLVSGKYYIYIAVFCVFAFFLPIFSQNEESQSLVNDKTADLSPFIFRNNLMSYSLYRQSDGEKLSYRKTRTLISTIPENNKLMRQEKIWRVSSQVLRGLTLASLCAAVVYYNDDSPRSSNAFQNSAVSLFTFAVFAHSSKIIANNKLQQGVDYYNYRIVNQ